MANAIADLNIKVTANAGGVSAGLKKAEKELSAFDGFVNKISGKGSGIGLLKNGLGQLGAAFGVGFTASAFISGIKDTINVLDDAGDLAEGLGDTADNISRLHFAAVQLGSSAGAVNSAMSKMTKSIGEAKREGGASAEAIKSLGLNVDTLAQMRTSSAFIAITNALSKLPTVYDRAAVASKIFGKGAMEIIAILKAGDGEIEKYGARLDEINGTMTEGSVEAAARLKDQIEELNASWAGGKARMVEDFERPLSFSLAVMQKMAQHAGSIADGLLKAFGGPVMSALMMMERLTRTPRKSGKFGPNGETVDPTKNADEESIADAEKNAERDSAMALRIKEKYANPQEQFNKKMEELNGLFKRGAITFDERARIQAQYEKEMRGAINKDRTVDKLYNDMVVAIGELGTGEMSGEEFAKKFEEFEKEAKQFEESGEVFSDLFLSFYGKLNEANKSIEESSKISKSIGGAIGDIAKGWKDFGESVTEEMKTPWENFLERVDKLNNAFKFGSISAETYQRALNAANREMYGDSAMNEGYISPEQQAFDDYNTPRGGWVGGSIPDNFRAFTTPEQSAAMGGRQSYAINQAAQGGGVSNESAELMTANQYLNQIARNTANMGMVA